MVGGSLTVEHVCEDFWRNLPQDAKEPCRIQPMHRDPRPTVTVAGPSHIRRFRHAMWTGRVAYPRRDLARCDRPGESITSQFFLQAEFARRTMPAICFVGDFRFGNRSLGPDPVPEDFSGVDKDAISPENDLEMYRRSLRALRTMYTNNPECRFVFWCLAGREFANRREGRYGQGGAYRHPTWNLTEVEDAVGDRAVRLSDLMHHPGMSLLHIDSSAHPSTYGMELMRLMIDDPDRPTVDP